MRTILALVTASLWGAAQPLPTVEVVKGAPYSADQMQSGPNSPGPYVIGHFFRDAEGRSRKEVALKPAGWGWRIELADPVTGFAYTLDDKKKIALRKRIQGAAVPASPTAPRGVTVEKLGNRIIEGLQAEGTRTSGALVIETWDSVELKINLSTKSSNGYSSWLTNIKRSDPDPALFWSPTGYSIVEQ
jgi:hypothetical protein